MAVTQPSITFPFVTATGLTTWILTGALTVAQTTEPPPGFDTSATGDADPEQIEVLARGPLHEAFARPVAHDPGLGPVIPQPSPEPIDEIPPDTRPDGDDVVWIPGYWSWDEERNDFIWISGVWRKAPPGREWVAGYWHPHQDGWQWVSGYWAPLGAGEPTPVEPPPESLERGPSGPAPSPNHFWIPGCWILDSNLHHWRPGYWHAYRAGRVWIPACYVLTPGGCFFVGGYWDYVLPQRGLVFAPVYCPPAVYRRVGFRYVPRYTIRVANLVHHLFVHIGSHHYCFGDYYAPTYVGGQIFPWYDARLHRHCYDPVLVHYSVHFRRRGINYVRRLDDWHRYFVDHSRRRPPRVHAAQSAFAVKHKGFAHVDHAILTGSLDEEVGRRRVEERFVRVGPEDRKKLARAAGGPRVREQQKHGRPNAAKDLRQGDREHGRAKPGDPIRTGRLVQSGGLATPSSLTASDRQQASDKQKASDRQRGFSDRAASGKKRPFGGQDLTTVQRHTRQLEARQRTAPGTRSTTRPPAVRNRKSQEPPTRRPDTERSPLRPTAVDRPSDVDRAAIPAVGGQPVIARPSEQRLPGARPDVRRPSVTRAAARRPVTATPTVPSRTTGPPVLARPGRQVADRSEVRVPPRAAKQRAPSVKRSAEAARQPVQVVPRPALRNHPASAAGRSTPVASRPGGRTQPTTRGQTPPTHRQLEVRVPNRGTAGRAPARRPAAPPSVPPRRSKRGRP